MQLLNPTLESKIYNPLSTLGIAGLSDLLQQDLTGNGSQAVSGLLQAASSFILPVSHVERHISNPFFFNQNRYEDAYKVDKYESGPDIDKSIYIWDLHVARPFIVPLRYVAITFYELNQSTVIMKYE